MLHVSSKERPIFFRKKKTEMLILSSCIANYKTMGIMVTESYFIAGKRYGLLKMQALTKDVNRTHLQLVLEFNYFRAHASRTTSCSFTSAAMSIVVNLRGRH